MASINKIQTKTERKQPTKTNIIKLIEYNYLTAHEQYSIQ